jgi:5-carboxymethyl-2-hydroxymuconate isomerase
MPHIAIEYSANLEAAIDIAGLCEVLRATAAGHPAFPMPGVRVRAYAAQHYAIADGDPKHGFIDISVRLREGRTNEIKKEATQTLFSVTEAFLEPALAHRSIALSMEMRDISADYGPKAGTIRKHLTNGGE